MRCRRRSAAPYSSPYDMGRPPGASRMRRRHMQDWELRDPRFEELESEEEDGQGVLVDPNSYAGRDARARGHVSDELYFDGYDIGRDRVSRRALYDQGRYGQDHDLGYRDQRGMAYQTHVREKEDSLIQSALGRIARARAKGKTNVNLSEEEMEALQRRNNPPPEPTPLPALASPPHTPAKSAKGSKVSSRSNSSTNLASQKTRKRGSTGLFGNGSSSSPAKSNSKAKVNRKPSTEQQTHQATPYPMGAPGVMIPGPDGVPVYTPLTFGPPSPEYRRANSSGSQPGSRSGSKHSRRESTPPERTDPYAQQPYRYYPPPSMRPPSSGSNRSLPDDPDWYPPTHRTRSASNAHSIGYPDHDAPSSPSAAAQSPRRNITTPVDMRSADLRGVEMRGPEMRYSPLRRTAAGSSPLAPRPGPGHASYSDPAIAGRSSSGLRRQFNGDTTESSGSGNGSSDDAGVQVDILEDERAGSGYTISRAPAAAPTSSGNEGRKRRAGRR